MKITLLKSNNIHKQPLPRYQCSLDFYQNKLYLFGGLMKENTDKSTYFNDLWEYSLTQNIWTQLPSNKNCKCAGHQSLIYQHYLIIYGGYTIQENGGWFQYKSNSTYLLSLENVHIYNIKTREWKEIKSINKPISRFWHSMISMNDNLIIYGGIDNSNPKNKLNDCWSININELIYSKMPKWKKYSINLGKLWGHTMNYLNNELKIHELFI